MAYVSLRDAPAWRELETRMPRLKRVSELRAIELVLEHAARLADAPS